MNSKKIKENILKGEKISWAHKYLAEKDLPASFRAGSPHNLPPFLHAKFEIEPGISSTACSTEALEKLSLAQRTKILVTKKPKTSSGTSEPHWFKKGRNAQKHKTTINGEELAQAIKAASHEGRENSTDIPVLKMIGVSISGDVDISRLDLPFSIRLIGCSIEGALLLDRTTLDTLDLTGTIITRGISANYMYARGAVRLRRVLSLAPLDFGGAHISATLDATDMILVPMNHQPDSISFVGDRGMLNLSLSTIVKDARLIRARLYGGANLRGAEIGGTLFLTDLLVRSPLATLDLLLMDKIRNNSSTDPYQEKPAAAVTEYASYDIARMLHKAPDDIEDKFENGAYKPANFERAVESLIGLDWLHRTNQGGVRDYPLLDKLLFESSTCRECSIRAENIKIEGNLLASRLRSCGLLRFRYADIGGRVDMKGVRLRDTRSILSNIRELQVTHERTEEALESILRSTLERVDELDFQIHNPVLDFEEADIGGALDLGRCNTRKGASFNHDVKGWPRESKVRKSIYHYGDGRLITGIAKYLVASRDDPLKFYSLFYPSDTIPATLFDRKWDQEPEYDSSPAEWLEYELKKLAVIYDPLFHKNFFKAKQIYLGKLGTDNTNLTDEASSEAEAFTEFSRFDRDPQKPKEVPKSKEFTSGVIKVLEAFGEVRSSLVIGWIKLENASISSHVKMRGLIANLFERKTPNTTEDQKTKTIQTFVEGKNVRIGGDIDFRDSAGISGINFDYAKIAGSIRFFTKAKYCSETDIYKPIEGRALLGSHNGKADLELSEGFNYNYGCVVRFKSASIGGNAQLLFDTHAGPSLKLFNASIKGNLTIAPTFGAFEITRTEYRERKEEANRIRKLGKVTPLQRVINIFFPRPNEIDRGYAQVRSINRSPRPVIDLRNASATVFGQSVRAWPVQDCLRINGFKYARSRSIGPLVPLRRSWKEINDDSGTNPISYLLLLPTLFLFVILALTCWHLFPISGFGLINFLILTTLAAYWLLKEYLSRLTKPIAEQTKPLAVDWLQLQRRQLNTRKVSSGVVPLEPYIRAAAVLRAAGRTRSANAVEYERLVQRRNALSMRYQFLLRGMLTLADWTMHFGFKPMRAVLVLLTVVILGAGFANLSSEFGMMTASDRQRLLLVGHEGEPLRDFRASMLRKSELPDRTCLIHERHETYPRFISTLYAVDIVVPFFDLNQDRYWSMVLPSEKQIDVVPCRHAVRSLDEVSEALNFRQEWYSIPNWFAVSIWGFTLFIELVGWLFTTIIAVSIASRLETILARNEEI